MAAIGPVHLILDFDSTIVAAEGLDEIARLALADDPEAFVRFWLETIRDWRRQTGRRVLVALSCTRDVQDAILADSALAAEVNIIDVKYWWYTADGTPYAPPGGERLAPRQQLRAWKGSKGRAAGQTVRQVRELRLAHPEKAVICSSEGSDPVAVLLGGGSLAAIGSLDPEVGAAIVAMKPVAGDTAGDAGCLEDREGRRVVADDPGVLLLTAPAAATPP